MHTSEKFFSDREKLRQILSCGKYTVLAMNDGNEPYILTISYGLDPKDDALYFHSSPKGMKLDFLKSNPYVCGTVIQDDGYQQGKCTHYYHSVVYSGVMEVIHDSDEKVKAMEAIFNQLEDQPERFINRFSSDPSKLKNVLIMKLQIDEMTGKHNPA